MNTAKWVAQHLVAAAMLLAPIGTPPAWAQTTMEDAEAAYWRGNYVTALSGFRIYAEQGLARAQYNLGVMYAQGGGVPKDAVHAYAWLSIAAAQGNTHAKEGKELVTKLMTQAQITEAQKRSREYWTRHVVPFQ